MINKINKIITESSQSKQDFTQNAIKIITQNTTEIITQNAVEIIIQNVVNAFDKGTVCFTTSFSIEDQVILDLLVKAGVTQNIDIVTLDTGRFFEDIYKVWNDSLSHFGVKIKSFHPNADALQSYIAENGPNAFYNSTELRHKCCAIRKIEPLKEAVKNKQLWITGLRAQHSPNRKGMPQTEIDPNLNIIKFHPILHWTTSQVREYAISNNVPFSSLHDKGYPSIGCECCTKAIENSTDFRAGRWWWEQEGKKECGLHYNNEK